MLIKVRNNDVGQALKVLKRKVADSGLLKDLKNHEFHRTKSIKKREKHKEHMKRVNKQKRLENSFE